MGCCPSKTRGAAYARSDGEHADKAEASAVEEGVPDVAVAEGSASCAGSGGANATAAASAPDAKRRVSDRVKHTARSSGEGVLGEEEEETKDGEEEDDAFDEDPRAHLIHATTTERSDSGDRAQFQLDASKFPSSGAANLESPASLALRSPAHTPVNFEDMPISSTYHRVLSATIADKAAKRKEEERLEAEQREREVQEYKAAMMLQV
jgi:hypothetical protein